MWNDYQRTGIREYNRIAEKNLRNFKKTDIQDHSDYIIIKIG